MFACLFLDGRHRVIAFEVLFYGTVDSAAIYPRQVVRRALEHNAAALICAHNHPSGSAEPSRADRDDRVSAAGGAGTGGRSVARSPGSRRDGHQPGRPRLHLTTGEAFRGLPFLLGGRSMHSLISLLPESCR